MLYIVVNEQYPISVPLTSYMLIMSLPAYVLGSINPFLYAFQQKPVREA